MPASCHCGTYAVADCARCGEPRCANHYYLSFALTSDKWLGMANSPIGRIDITFSGKPPGWADAYASAGPGCDLCRTEAANQRQSSRLNELRARVDDFVRHPKLEDALAVWPLYEEAAVDPEGRILAAIARLAEDVPSTVVWTVALSRSPRFESKLGGRTKPIVSVVSEAPAVRVGALYITPEQKVFVCKSGLGNVPAVPQRLFFERTQNGRPPEFDYYGPTSAGWGNDAEGSKWAFQHQLVERAPRA